MTRTDHLVRIAVILASLLAVTLLILPPIVLVLRALDARAWEYLPDSGIMEAVSLSLTTTFLTAVIIILVGTPLAYALARWRVPLRGIVNLLVQLPIVLPPAVAGLALLITFGQRGFLGGLLDELNIQLAFTAAAVIIAQVFVSAPFYIRSAQAGFQSIPDEIEDAARVDGASGIVLFWHITLPLARRPLAVGLTLSWTRALGEFGATILFAGSLSGRTQTMPLLIYNVLERGNIDAAILTGLILITIALITLALLQWLNSRIDRLYTSPEPAAATSTFV